MAVALVLGLAVTASAEVTSGPQVGAQVGAFTVTKVAGNADDGVEAGKSLCYRCKMGARPVVMVFARTADANLAKLLKKLEEEVAEHESDKLTGFVNMIGGDADSLKKQAAAVLDAEAAAGIAGAVASGMTQEAVAEELGTVPARVSHSRAR